MRKVLRDVLWSVGVIVLGFVTLIAVGVTLSYVMDSTDRQRNAGHAEAIADRSQRRATRLTGVAIFRNNSGFRVCSRHNLTRCVFRAGSATGPTQFFQSFNVPSVPLCDTQAEDAIRACADAGDLMSDANAMCMLRHGMLRLQISQASDPRDEQLPAGFCKLQCAEGFIDAQFRDDTF